MTIPFVDLKSQYQSLKPEMDAAIAAVIAETAFIGGKAVAEFERAFAEYNDVPHCVSCANGTEAIEIALRALGVESGDEVVVPANTFFATSEAVTSAGADVVFADCEPDHFTLDPEDFRAKITARTKAVIPVHLYGHPADMDPIMAIAREHDIRVIEDVSQAHGAIYKGAKAGSLGDAATFSFYPGKNLGAYGDGGAMVFRDPAAATFARTYANHGSLVKYHHLIEGRNSRLDGIQAAVLSVKLKHLDQWNAARRRNAGLYDELLADVPGIVAPKVSGNVDPVWHLYVVRVMSLRDEIVAGLNGRGVGAAIHYPFSLPTTEAYMHMGHEHEDFPVANSQMSQVISMPMYPELTPAMIAYAVDCLKQEVEGRST